MSVGQRFKAWGIKEFGNVEKFAKAFEVKPSSLYKYFNDQSLPGGKIIVKIVKYGGDLNYIYGQDEAIGLVIPGSSLTGTLRGLAEKLSIDDSESKLTDVIDQLQLRKDSSNITDQERQLIEETLAVLEKLLTHLYLLTDHVNDIKKYFPWSEFKILNRKTKTLLAKLDI